MAAGGTRAARRLGSLGLCEIRTVVRGFEEARLATASATAIAASAGTAGGSVDWRRIVRAMAPDPGISAGCLERVAARGIGAAARHVPSAQSHEAALGATARTAP